MMPHKHEIWENSVADALKTEGFEVETPWPPGGAPDLLIRIPGGTVSVEIKVGDHSRMISSATVSQLSSQEEYIASKYPDLKRKVVLLTNMEIPRRYEERATALGYDLIVATDVADAAVAVLDLARSTAAAFSGEDEGEAGFYLKREPSVEP